MTSMTTVHRDEKPVVGKPKIAWNDEKLIRHILKAINNAAVWSTEF